ncbi:MAG TPA: SLBB domain-containing protein, partial [Spirochaetales bacterium]|nr:SLBB domain-containing protein [Spirochaetales bacterium]
VPYPVHHGSQSPIDNAFLPLNAYVALAQGENGQDARVVLTEGTEVREGQLIARGSGRGSVSVHSPIPGIVRRITRMRMHGGQERGVAVVSLAGSFSILGKRQERYLWKSLNKNDILHIIQEKGVVSAAHGQSLYDLFTENREAPVDALVVNMLEMDSYRRTEAEICRIRCADVADGVAISAKIMQPARVILAMDTDFSEALAQELLHILHEASLESEIMRFKRRYPQDMPALLMRAIGKRSVGTCMVLEPSALVTLHDAVVANKAHIEQYVYVGGRAVKHPAVLKARIGTPIGDLIEECGGFVGPPAKIVVNGPYSGQAADLDVPVTRTTRAILALHAEETNDAPRRACVRCGACRSACPENLDPHLIYKYIAAGRTDEAVAIGLNACIECGSCAWACWSRIPLTECFSAAKKGDSHA